MQQVLGKQEKTQTPRNDAAVGYKLIELVCKNGAADGVVLFLHPFLKSLRRQRAALELLIHQNQPTATPGRTRTWVPWRARAISAPQVQLRT